MVWVLSAIAADPDPTISVVRVNITRQGYDFHRPWEQEPTSAKTAIGVIIMGSGQGSRILMTASPLANHRYIELEYVNNGKKSPARVEFVDYEANLALLKPEDDEFLKKMVPLSIAEKPTQKDVLAVWQVLPNGNIMPSLGPITAVELTAYPHRNRFLAYRMNHSLQYRLNNATLPVVKEGKIAGLLMKHDAKAQTTDVVAAPVIRHFLKDAEDGVYQGFPRPGFTFVSMEDPQLRRFVGLKDQEGVYIEKILEDSNAEKAGLLQGDILLSVNGYEIDNRGNYTDPLYGKLSITHPLRCGFFHGDSIRHRVFRKGKIIDLDVTMAYRSPESFLVRTYIVDRPPGYVIFGGLVLQELSLSYLKEYGTRWRYEAPVHLVYYAQNQNYLHTGEREKIVFISSVLPTSWTIGYEDLGNRVIHKINDRPIRKLSDVLTAFDSPVDGFHKIEMEQRPKTIYLDPKQIEDIHGQLKKRYHLPGLSNLQ